MSASSRLEVQASQRESAISVARLRCVNCTLGCARELSSDGGCERFERPYAEAANSPVGLVYVASCVHRAVEGEGASSSWAHRAPEQGHHPVADELMNFALSLSHGRTFNNPESRTPWSGIRMKREDDRSSTGIIAMFAVLAAGLPTSGGHAR